MVTIPHKRLISLLSDSKWHKAPEICQGCGFADSRPIREYAELTGAIIGGPQGYKLAALATAEELEHAGHSLLSRGRKNAHRGLAHLKQAKALREVPGPLFTNARG